MDCKRSNCCSGEVKNLTEQLWLWQMMKNKKTKKQKIKNKLHRNYVNDAMHLLSVVNILTDLFIFQFFIFFVESNKCCIDKDEEKMKHVKHVDFLFYVVRILIKAKFKLLILLGFVNRATNCLEAFCFLFSCKISYAERPSPRLL